MTVNRVTTGLLINDSQDRDSRYVDHWLTVNIVTTDMWINDSQRSDNRCVDK